jgi:hypothetical protein
MIQSDRERDELVIRFHEARRRIELYRRKLTEQGLADDEIERALDPTRSFYAQFADEINACDGGHQSQAPRCLRQRH